VLVGWPLPRDLMVEISGLNEHIKLLNDPDHDLVRPDVWPPFPFPESLLEFLPQCEILFTSRVPRNLESLAPNLKWVQLLSAGVDEVKRANLEYSDIAFTTSKGVHSRPLSEWVIGAMLAMVKNIPQIVEAKRKREYRKFIGGELSGLTAGILGVGNVGLRVAHICKALDMSVIGTRRFIKSVEKDYGPVDELFPSDQLSTVLERSDFLIICLPIFPMNEWIKSWSDFPTLFSQFFHCLYTLFNWWSLVIQSIGHNLWHKAESNYTIIDGGNSLKWLYLNTFRPKLN